MGKNAENQALLHKKAHVETHILYGKGPVDVWEEKVFLEKNSCSHWINIRHPGAVAILPIDHKGNVLLVEQWRRGVGEITLEVPAGFIDPKEEPLAAAQRELQEETGYKAGRWMALGGCYTSPSLSNEYIHLFLALALEESILIAEDTHQIDKEWVSLSTALQLIEKGKITDAKTILLLLRYSRGKE